jgi:hypothetical protein
MHCKCKIYEISLMHPYSLVAFSWYQEQSQGLVVWEISQKKTNQNEQIMFYNCRMIHSHKLPKQTLHKVL